MDNKRFGAIVLSINQTMGLVGFPCGCVSCVNNAISKFDETERTHLSKVVSLYENEKEKISLDSLKPILEYVQNKKRIHPYLFSLICFLAMGETLKAIYEERGYSKRMYVDAMKDVLYKAVECHLVKGVWGNFVPQWEIGFFQLRLFSFGMIQFEIGPVRYARELVGIEPGKKVLFFHIPRTGHSLDFDEVKKEFDEGLSFFEGQIDYPIVFCYSYLLHPINLELLPERSNIRKLFDMFEIVATDESEDYSELWRLFDMEVSESNIDNLPCDTSLRRNYIALMKQGKKMGHGVGIIDLRR